MTQLAEARGVSDKVRVVMVELRQRLNALYGDRLVHVILYGSQARGDYRWWSDVDVMVVLKGPVDYMAERSQTAHIFDELSLDSGMVIMSAFADEQRFLLEDIGLLRSAREEGIAA